MATSSREARRRKIMDRSSDRLALITGRIQTLPSSPSSDLPSEIDSDSFLAVDTPKVSAHEKDEASYPIFPGENSAIVGPTEVDCGGSNQVPPVRTFENNGETLSESISRNIDPRSSMFSSTEISQSASAMAPERHAEARARKSELFGIKQISSAVAATERTRLFCSITFATFVVLSYLGFPVLGSRLLKGVLGFRPLVLVLLANFTVVLTQLLEKQQSPGVSDRGRNRVSPPESNDMAEQLGKALEIGLLIHKIADAVFMDCAVYAVIIVCGLSFADKFF